MIYINLISDIFLRLENEGNLLLSSLKNLEELLSNKKDLTELENHIKYIDKLSISFNSIQCELINMINSTHYNKLSTLVTESKNENLQEQLNRIRFLIYDIAIQARSTNELLTLCQKLNYNQLNLLVGKRQEPTNYNFNQTNINKHLFNKIKTT